MAGQDDPPGALRKRPSHRRLDVAPFCLPVPEVTRRGTDGAEVVAVGDRESGKSHAVHDVDNAQHILSGAVLSVNPDDERAARSRKVPRGKWPERARYDYVLHGNTQRRFRIAQEVRPIESGELPRRGSRSGYHASRPWLY